MNKPIAIDACYADYRRVKGRKVHQIVFEVASEQWPRIYALLGEPSIEGSEWWALARLKKGDTEASQSKPEADTDAPLASGRHFDELKLSQQAGIMCGREDFQDWLRLQPASDGLNMRDSNEAAEAVRNLCGVASRSEFDHDPIAAKAWRELYDQFRASQLAEAHEMH